MKSRVFVLAFLVQIFTLLPMESQACPLGAKESTLTVQRVMLNFGKYIGQADHIALLGAKYPNETVTDAQIADAVNKIGLAISCAEAVIANPTGDLLPSKATFLEGDALKEYIEDYVYFMTDFRDAMIHYKASFAALGVTKAADRDWNSLYEESEKLNDLINHAHRKMSDAGSLHSVVAPRMLSMMAATPGGSLKQNMKAAEKNLKAIALTINDSSKNEENAALAYDAAAYFHMTYSQVPESISDLPASRQQEALQGYQAQIRKSVEMCVSLQQALLANDIDTATDILKALSDLKKEGHDEFNH
ncbi:cytochrome b562 [Bdellovibrio svalbardensis]|uniref:Cytochrome b562 n=1 Tax=Bdellovibrio svalbardensis TaxID=2972972 RepID=A0ABT6DJ37_9BACT|nr:cytochrome b562 [Bdellovibrio svalbardensis]MDG0816878.1 cytochrome b562 [Bdellovibrio svalbardensis]